MKTSTLDDYGGEENYSLMKFRMWILGLNDYMPSVTGVTCYSLWRSVKETT